MQEVAISPDLLGVSLGNQHTTDYHPNLIAPPGSF